MSNYVFEADAVIRRTVSFSSVPAPLNTALAVTQVNGKGEG